MTVKRVFADDIIQKFKTLKYIRYTKHTYLNSYRVKSDIDINLKEFEEYIWLAGDDIFIFRDILPKNYDDDKTPIPLGIVGDCGFAYKNNKFNRKPLYLLVRKLNILVDEYKAEKKLIDLSNPVKRETGILEYEVNFFKKKWFNDIFKNYDYNIKLNPIILKDNTYKFYRCGIEKQYTPFLNGLKKLRKEWEYVYDIPISMDTSEIDLSYFKKHKSFLFNMTEPVNHIFFGSIEGNKITMMETSVEQYFHDEHMKHLKNLTNNEFEISFRKRKHEQNNEETCGQLSIIRACMISEFGISSITEPIDPNYAVAFSLLVENFNMHIWNNM